MELICQICATADFELVLVAGVEIGRERRTLYVCKSCGLVYFFPTPTRGTMGIVNPSPLLSPTYGIDPSARTTDQK